MKPVVVRNVAIGEAIPKICVPIVGKMIDEILNQAKHICEIGADVVEWRVDWFEEVNNYESVENAAKQLRDILGETPILFTFRTAKEGGERAIEPDEYVELNEKIAKSGYVAAGYGEYILAVTSSHFGSAEKEFRFPLSYANQRPLSAHWTVTGSGAFLVGEKESHVRISGLTVGKIVDYGLKDSQNMGACMAPAACNTIWQNLQDFGRSPEDYSRIITGDLGYVGQSILFDLLLEKGYDIRGKHLDCGMTIFDQQTQDTHAGGSGCGCAATLLSAYILPKIERGEWERVLFVPTGALMSTVSYNEGASVPGIAHAIVLEHEA